MRMRLHHLPKILLALFTAAVLASGGIAPTPAAASAAKHAVATVTEGTKVTLHETSIDGPGFASTEIAWTGTDAAHHLNVQCTTQFPQFPDPAHTKTELSEAALGAPGFVSNEIAWTGTDAAHQLNVAQLQGL